MSWIRRPLKSSKKKLENSDTKHIRDIYRKHQNLLSPIYFLCDRHIRLDSSRGPELEFVIKVQTWAGREIWQLLHLTYPWNSVFSDQRGPAATPNPHAGRTGLKTFWLISSNCVVFCLNATLVIPQIKTKTVIMDGAIYYYFMLL